MYVVVFLQLGGLSEPLVALAALERQISLILVPGHVNREGGEYRRLVVALFARVARQKVRLLVPRQVPEQSELLGAVLAREVAHCMAHQVFLVVALVPEHLAARVARVLLFQFLITFLFLLLVLFLWTDGVFVAFQVLA